MFYVSDVYVYLCMCYILYVLCAVNIYYKCVKFIYIYIIFSYNDDVRIVLSSVYKYNIYIYIII